MNDKSNNCLLLSAFEAMMKKECRLPPCRDDVHSISQDFNLFHAKEINSLERQRRNYFNEIQFVRLSGVRALNAL